MDLLLASEEYTVTGPSIFLRICPVEMETVNSLANMLKECSQAHNFLQGKHVHSRIIHLGLTDDRFLCNLLIKMYGDCNSLVDAERVFASLRNKNLHSWTLMISACSRNACTSKAFHLLWEMDQEGVKPDRVVFIELLGACSSPKFAKYGEELHRRVSATFDVSKDVLVATSLISMFGRSGRLFLARDVFESMAWRNVVTWNAMLTAYANLGYSSECVELLERMDVPPNEVTFVVTLDSCCTSLEFGSSIHQKVVEQALQRNPFIATSLINMYSRCRRVCEARRVFDELLLREWLNVVAWTSMIAAYARNNCFQESLQLFREMDLEGVETEEMTLINVLAACSGLKALGEGRRIHARMSLSGFRSDFASSSIISMYSKAGSLAEARRVFTGVKSTTTNLVCWTAMLAAYAQHEENEQALRLYREMSLEGLKPDNITFATALTVCASLGELCEGRRIHQRVKSRDSDVVLGTALVDMYSKCGRLDEAKVVFDRIAEKNVFSWTAMVGGYAHNGQGAEAVGLFKEMVSSAKIPPNEVTFTSVLSACSHAGLVEEGREFFRVMSAVHGIEPSAEHFGCMVDLLGRAGRLEEAEKMIRSMPMRPDAVVWETLLGACKVHGDLERGARVAEEAVHLNPKNAANYVVLSDLYV